MAAENFYGDLAAQVGGDRVSVYDILKDPSVDPHEYEPAVDDAKAVAEASVVIKNGLGYDSFADHLLQASPRAARRVLDAGELTGYKMGDNPHIWYDPRTMPEVARRLEAELVQLRPGDKPYFDDRLRRFTADISSLNNQIASMKTKYAGVKVLPTESVFNYMAGALGLAVVDAEGAFQKAVETGTDPPAAAVAQFRGLLSSRSVKALIYNNQTVTPITSQMQNVAKQSGVPIVGVSELEPLGTRYQQWMADELKSLDQALAK